MPQVKPVVLITGAAAGIGHATALAFARAGYRIATSDLNRERSASLINEIKTTGSEAVFIQVDHSKEADCARAISETLQAFGRLDAAINNAGVEGIMDLNIEQQTEANFRHTLSVNLDGVLWSMKYEIPALLKSGGGCIVNVSSVAGSIGMAGMAAYVASKHAVEGLTKVAALENAARGIRVNAVAPGAIQTEMIERIVGQGENQARRDLAAQHPMNRIGDANEVAQAILFLCSPASSFITGHILPVDGGWLAK
jgi:NAD(P)-dependent dehydrogenase (short-subunit alcohol dehydrogenase family)